MQIELRFLCVHPLPKFGETGHTRNTTQPEWSQEQDDIPKATD